MTKQAVTIEASLFDTFLTSMENLCYVAQHKILVPHLTDQRAIAAQIARDLTLIRGMQSKYRRATASRPRGRTGRHASGKARRT